MPFTVSFLSDLGARDAAVCRAVLYELSPDARVLDIDHELAPHNVGAANFALMQVVQYLPTGAVIAAVDPRAGHPEQRYIGVQSGSLTLLAPDNGAIAGAVGLLGGTAEAISLENPEHRLSGFGPTFAARDILSPAAAALANGVPLSDLGPAVDPAALMPALLVLPSETDGALEGQVWHVDRYGNCVLNIDPGMLSNAGVRVGETLEVVMSSGARRGIFGRTFSELEPSELGVGIDATGLLTLWMANDAVATRLNLKSNDSVTIRWEQK